MFGSLWFVHRWELETLNGARLEMEAGNKRF
jgi:hypothetical protein